jgi:hypothetical protein
MDMPRTSDNGFDAAVVDRENQPVALVEVKASPVEKWPPFPPGQLAKFAERIPFVLTVDLNRIHVYRPSGEDLGEPIAQLDTLQVLQHYDPELSKRRVFDPYLLTLVESWLQDLAYHWKSANPPGSEEIARAGLLEKMEGGTTERYGD